MDNKIREKLALLQLPLTAQEKIIENLDNNSQAKLSQTSTFYRELIGGGCHLHFNLSETYGKSCLDKLKHTRLKFIHFTHGKYRPGGGKKTAEGNRGLFSEMFPFPLDMKTLIFSQKVDAGWIFEVLEKCVNLKKVAFNDYVEISGDLKSLLLNDKGKELKINSRCFALAALCRNQVFFSEIYLTKLNELYIDFRDRNLGDEEFINVICLIKSLRSEVLKKLFLVVTPKISLSEMEYFRVCWILGGFLEFHVKTIQDMSIGVCVGDHQIRDDKSIRVEEALLSYMMDLNLQTEPNEIQGQGDSFCEKRKSVKEKVDMILHLRENFEKIAKESKISFLSLDIPIMYHWDFWHVFVENLHRLCTIRILCSTNFNILKNCAIISGSYKTLKRLRLNLDLKNPFDCSGLADCERLEEFYLFYSPQCNQPVMMGPDEPNVLNVNLIPAGLKSLALNNVVLTTKDINKALSKQNNLDTLVIMNMASFNPRNGADYKSLKKVFRMRNLQSCLLFQLRCRSKAIYTTTVKLLEQAGVMSRLMKNIKIPYVEGFQIPFALDIVSTECYRRYIWEMHCLSYHLRFNDEDPHL